MPGGHLELNESLEEGVVREIFEETGVEIKAISNDKGAIQYFHQGEECFLEPFYGFESVGRY